MIQNKEVHKIPILILANKQDKENAATAGEVARSMMLHKVEDHSYAILPTSAANGFNVMEALEWIRQRLTEKIKDL